MAEKKEEMKVPVLSVLKKGSILKHIFLNSPPQSNGGEEQEEEEDDPIVIGRHPDCHIVLDHPSISRFHLQLRIRPISQKLSVTDLSSVHGTWISGTRIEPKTPVDLTDGDTMRIGGSTKVYRLEWVPREMAGPLPALPEEREETHQDEESERVEIPIGPRSDDLISENLEEIESGEEVRSVVNISDDEENTFVEKNGSDKEEAFGLDKEILESCVNNEKEEGVSGSEMKFDKGVEAVTHENSIQEISSIVHTGLKSDDPILENLANIGNDEEEAFAIEKESQACGDFSGDLEVEEPITENCVSSEKEEEVSGLEMENIATEVVEDLNLEKPVSEKHVNRRKEEETSKENWELEPVTENCVRSEKEEEVFDLVMENIATELVEDLNLEKAVSKNHLNRREEEKTSSVEELQKSLEVLKRTSSIGISKTFISSEGDETLVQHENLKLEVSSDQKLEKSHRVELRSSLNVIMASDGKEEVLCSIRENRTPVEVPTDLKLKKFVTSNTVRNEREVEAAFTSNKENMTPDSSGVQKSKQLPSETHSRIKNGIMKKREERIPFQNLSNSDSVSFSPTIAHEDNNTITNLKPASSSPLIQAQKSKDEQKITWKSSLDPIRNMVVKEKKKWNIVVDTSCFLDEESVKSLQLLEGLRGTHIIIPRIVIRELDCLKRRENWFRRETKVSSALKWIEDCMVKKSWWIHVQSLSETLPSMKEEGNNESKSSVPFSTCRSLMEIGSPTAEDHILDTALMFKRIRTDGHLILLTDNISLKIKAMAEGLICETPKEFRDSLVKPYSKRFLWAESIPRGPTWSLSDQIGLSENWNFHQQWMNIKRTGKVSEGVKGLKVVLLHSSHQMQ